MSKRDTGQVNTRHKRELLKLPNGCKTYMLFIIYVQFLKGLRHICVSDTVLNGDFSEKVKEWHKQRVKDSTINCIILDNSYALSIIIRKLKFPFLTGIDYFDNHTRTIARQKMDKLNQVIPPEIMEQLTDLEIPFPFESELSAKPVVAILQ